jgi:ATP-dependent DNA ligase
MTLPLSPPYAPLEALLVDRIPAGEQCLAFRDGDDVELRSRSGQPLARYVPEVVDNIRASAAR